MASPSDISLEKANAKAKAKAYKGKPSRCNLCLAEKLCILTAQNASVLNKRSELVTSSWQPIRRSVPPTVLEFETFITDNFSQTTLSLMIA